MSGFSNIFRRLVNGLFKKNNDQRAPLNENEIKTSLSVEDNDDQGRTGNGRPLELASKNSIGLATVDEIDAKKSDGTLNQSRDEKRLILGDLIQEQVAIGKSNERPLLQVQSRSLIENTDAIKTGAEYVAREQLSGKNAPDNEAEKEDNYFSEDESCALKSLAEDDEVAGNGRVDISGTPAFADGDIAEDQYQESQEKHSAEQVDTSLEMKLTIIRLVIALSKVAETRNNINLLDSVSQNQDKNDEAEVLCSQQAMKRLVKVLSTYAGTINKFNEEKNRDDRKNALICVSIIAPDNTSTEDADGDSYSTSDDAIISSIQSVDIVDDSKPFREDIVEEDGTSKKSRQAEIGGYEYTFEEYAYKYEEIPLSIKELKKSKERSEVLSDENADINNDNVASKSVDYKENGPVEEIKGLPEQLSQYDCNKQPESVFTDDNDLCEAENIDNTNDEYLKEKYPLVYKRLHKVLEHNYKHTGVTIGTLFSDLKYIARQETIEEILSKVSWAKREHGYYYFYATENKEVVDNIHIEDVDAFDNDSVTDVDDASTTEPHSKEDQEEEYVATTANYNQDRTLLALEDKRTFEEIFNIKRTYFTKDSIELLNPSVRAHNILTRYKCKTVADLLSRTPKEVFEYKNLGQKTFNEIVNKAKEYCLVNVAEERDNSLVISEEVMARLFQYKDQILQAEQPNDSFDVNDNEDVMVQEKLRVFSIIDNGLLKACEDDHEAVQNLISTLSDFYRQYLPNEIHLDTFKKIEKQIPKERLSQPVKGFIFAYSKDDKVKECLEKYIIVEGISVAAYLKTIKQQRLDYESFNILNMFIRWMSFDLTVDIDSFKKSLYRNEREKEVIELRSKKKTLDQIGKKISLTRERVRQLERKVISRFSRCLSSYRIIRKIYAVRGEDVILSPAEMQEYFGEDTGSILYLMKITDHRDYVYDPDFDVFIVEKTTIKDSIRKYMDLLPDSFTIDDIAQIIERGVEEYELTAEIIKRAIEERYNKSGNLYHINRVTLRTIYQEVLQRYYPTGIHVYDKKELQNFRNHARDLFGEIELPETDRALTAGLRRDNFTILCGRGIYRLQQEEYIPEWLAVKIQRYIDRSNQRVFLTNAIFYEFQEDLERYGVDNKYYLQGILKSLYGDEYYFRRDYIMKDAEDTTIHSSIQNYVKHSKHPVTKGDIKNHFPGVTDVIITMALADKSIIKMWHKYLDASKIQFSQRERAVIDRTMRNMVLNENGYAHIKDIYEVLNDRIPDALMRNSILQSYDLLSVLGYMYSKSCAVSRPYIAKRGVEVGKISERMEEFITNDDVINISSITEYAKKLHMGYPGIIALLDRYSERYLFVNNKQIASYEYIGIDTEKMKQVDKILQQEVSDTVAIRELHCINQFPSLNVNWNEWLIYSIEKVISDRLEVATSDSQMRRAVPLIAPRGKMQADYDVHWIADYEKGDLTSGKNIENIDDLLEEFIEELFDDIDYDV